MEPVCGLFGVSCLHLAIMKLLKNIAGACITHVYLHEQFKSVTLSEQWN